MKNGKNEKLFLDAGTTWSKIVATQHMDEFIDYFIQEKHGKYYYVLPSGIIKNSGLIFNKATGHMALGLLKSKEDYINEIIALVQGSNFQSEDGDGVILDLGSRDVKWVKFKDSKFSDLDWNSSCASATGATVEMLLKFYDVNIDDLETHEQKYPVTCGIFGLEKIMDDVSKGISAQVAIAKFIHGLAFNAWTFTKKPEKLFLSGGFCENKCFVASLQKYCEVVNLGRFVLVEGLIL